MKISTHFLSNTMNNSLLKYSYKTIFANGNMKYLAAIAALFIVNVVHPVSAQTTSAAAMDFTTSVPKVYDRCSPNRTEEPRRCVDGVILKHWPPALVDEISTPDRIGRTLVYFFVLFYLFLGVSIVADRFMASIEVITSKEKEIIIKRPNGETTTTTVRIWNETVSNLTLMALGSSAPEIMLSVIEIMGKGFHAGELGPSTIVGSASFNLFIIIAICIYVIPDGEVRKIKHPRVFAITAVWSILAYVWLYIILAVISKGVVEIWEGVITFFFFPILVVLAWIADRRLLVYKYMYKRYRARRALIVETEGGPEGNRMADGEELQTLSQAGSHAGTLSRSIDTLEGKVSLIIDDDADIAEVEKQKKDMVRLLRDLKKRHPDADMQELARMANIEALNHQQKSRAFYRIQATRKMTGAGNILKVKADKTNKAESLSNILEGTELDHIQKISFDPPEYKVMENCGHVELQVVRRGGDINSTIYVDYRTEDGTANAGSDYEYTEGSVVFHSGETIAVIQVPIIDDDIFEEDEYFRVKLRNVRVGASDGSVESSQKSNRQARLEPPAVATVIILDDDHAGVFSFTDESITISESVGVLKIPVKRDAGARGHIVIPYKTVPWTANGGGEDYIDTFGELEFKNDETIKDISVQVIDDEEYEKNKSFFLELGEPRLIHSTNSDSELGEPCRAEEGKIGNDTGSDSGINGPGDDEKKLIEGGEVVEDEDEAKRIAELGKPRLGEYAKIEIMIEESYEFKNTVDKLIRKANLAVIVGTSSWREQFVEALSVKGGDDDEEENDSEPSGLDYVMHYLTVVWKLLFAFIPPTEYFGGWACFTASIIGIGLLTAVIGDVASHFGCTIKLNDAVTAVTLVAMGTSVPDTFASKVAACGDQYADASIGNVTGSNAVNVFLGIGIAWTMAAVYWAIVGKTPEERQFKVDPGNLAFSVTVFSIFAVFAITMLMIRRYAIKSVGAELGGPRTAKIITSIIFICLWLMYIILAALDSYCVIKTF